MDRESAISSYDALIGEIENLEKEISELEFELISVQDELTTRLQGLCIKASHRKATLERLKNEEKALYVDEFILKHRAQRHKSMEKFFISGPRIVYDHFYNPPIATGSLYHFINNSPIPNNIERCTAKYNYSETPIPRSNPIWIPSPTCHLGDKFNKNQ